MSPTTDFPVAEQDFADDPRVYFARQSQSYRLEDEDGIEWEWLPATSKWKEVLDDEAELTVDGVLEKAAQEAQEEAKLAKLQAHWGAQFGEEEASPAAQAAEDVSEDLEAKKRKDAAKARLAEEKEREEATRRREAADRAIYVTGLPLDTDEMEIHTVFSKCGLIDESVDSDKPRIKLYYNDKNEFKGEALIVYYKHEHALKSIEMWNGADFRVGHHTNGDLKVAIAESSYKKNNPGEAEQPTDNQSTKRKHQSGGDDQSSQNPKRKRMMNDKEYKAKKKAKLIEMEKKIAWDDDDDDLPSRNYSNRWERMIILKGMFTPEKLAADSELYDDVKEDVKMMCGQWGEITNTVIWDAEPEGIVTVRFANVETAAMCQKETDGRKYDGVPVRVSISTGYEKFKKKTSSSTTGEAGSQPEVDHELKAAEDAAEARKIAAIKAAVAAAENETEKVL